MRIASRRDRDARHTEARRLHRRLAVRARVTAGAVASPGTLLPEAARRLRIGMPHLDAGGLSENWLFRAAGDLHWEAITRRLGVPTHEIETAGHERLYPMVIALRARYDAPLSAVRENDVLTWSVDVVPCGGACARGLIVARIGDRCFRLELLTSFAERRSGGTMRMALPAARLAAGGEPALPEGPALTPDAALDLAQELIDSGRAFRAHEVLEASWKAAPARERELWKGLAQVTVGLTHAQRGNAAGAVVLLRRGGRRVAEYAQSPPHGIDAAAVARYAAELADRIERDGLAAVSPATLRVSLRAAR